MSGGSSWYQDPEALLTELRRSRPERPSAPEIPGYDHLREIGRGGQGTVYAATQRSTRRTVAIKVLAESAPGGAGRRRFEREIDLVASLNHPGIVSIYDSGMAADGRAFLVMELIGGVPIDEYAAPGDSPRPLGDVLDLFAEVCEAVNFAHQRGVIHRDLKPSNIRVDAEGRPHILDFGLAKATGTGAVDLARTTAPVVSSSGQFIGSVPWASPEQAEGDAAKVDVRSDVYALGVIVYQLLTGEFPYAVDGPLRQTLENIARAEPARPSTHRAGIDDDLDTIVLKCLSKAPDRRYQTAGDVARDLRHYLAGEPIEAKRDSAWYTIRKTLRRYQIAAGVGVAFVLLVTGALIVSVGLYRAAVRDRDTASRQSARSQAMTDFLLRTINAADPDQDGKDVKLLDLLDRSAGAVEATFAGQDDLRATMHRTLRGLYLKLGQIPKAEAEAKAAMEIASGGEDRRAALGAAAEYWDVVHKAGRSQEAEPEMERVLAEQERAFGKDDKDTISTAADLGQVYKANGKPEDAAALYRRALGVWKGRLSEDDDRVLQVRERLATVLHDMGQMEEALNIDRDVVERRRRVTGPRNSATITAIGNLAVALIDAGKPAEAEPLQREELAWCEECLGPEHPDTLSVMNNLSKTLQDLGKLDESQRMMEATLQGRIKVLGEDHPFTLITMSNLGSLYALQKKPERSLETAKRCLDLRLKKLGENQLETVISMNNYAGSLSDMGRTAEAEGQYRRAVEIAGRILPADHWIGGVFRSNLANCLTTLGKYEESESLLLPAYELIKGKLGPTHPQAKKARKNLARLYDQWKKPERAAGYREEPGAAAPAK